MKNQVKILLVEDEVITAMLIIMQMQNIGYNIVSHVTTGENAIISAKQYSPDVILMDIRLAGELDGIEAAEKIQAESDIPVIFITGYDDPEVRTRAEKLKPLGYLVKPLEIQELKLILEAYFEVYTPGKK